MTFDQIPKSLSLKSVMSMSQFQGLIQVKHRGSAHRYLWGPSKKVTECYPFEPEVVGDPPAKRRSPYIICDDMLKGLLEKIGGEELVAYAEERWVFVKTVKPKRKRK